jgi:hypothetical protein
VFRHGKLRHPYMFLKKHKSAPIQINSFKFYSFQSCFHVWAKEPVFRATWYWRETTWISTKANKNILPIMSLPGNEARLLTLLAIPVNKNILPIPVHRVQRIKTRNNWTLKGLFIRYDWWTEAEAAANWNMF